MSKKREELEKMTNIELANLIGYPKNGPKDTPTPFGAWLIVFRMLQRQGALRDHTMKDFLIKLQLRRIVEQ